MANLWRTQRPRIPQYASDGSGRDYYIKYDNGGIWENEKFKILKKPDYEYSKYSNYHTLFHQAAPVKYIPTGAGRETYIINSMGLCHDQRPLASYHLGEFLRNSKSIEVQPKYKNKRLYKSKAEKRYNIKLQSLEKQLIHRLYNFPMNIKKRMKLEEYEKEAPSSNFQNKDNESINNDYNNTINGRGADIRYVESMPNINRGGLRKKIFDLKNKKFDKFSLSNNIDKILMQTQQIENYEMNNNARRNNNESDYNIYKNGKLGCRIKNLKYSSEISKYLSSNRVNTDGNMDRKRKKLFNSYSQKPADTKFKYLEYI